MNRIVGTERDDQIGGTAGDDEIILLGGNDTSDGGAGNDMIYGGSGDDILLGGVGDDTLSGEYGRDVLYGWDGNDYLYGSRDQPSTFYGGAGIDRFYPYEHGGSGSGGEGYDVLDLKFSGAATIRDEGNKITVETGGIVSVYTSIEEMAGSEGADIFYGRTNVGRFDGRGGGDAIYGGWYGGYLSGGEGDDYIYGGAGKDIIDGGEGNDRLYGDLGDDSLYGGNGDDLLSGGFSGVDRLQGAAGFDSLEVTDNLDSLDGGEGVDTAWLTSAGEVNLAGGYARLYSAGAGRCAVEYVENGRGSEENDTLVGDARSNDLYGAGGNDRLRGGGGEDLLMGGRGADTFELRWADVARPGQPAGAHILDFAQLEGDRINLRAIDANAGLAGDQAFHFIGAAAFTAAGQLSVKEVDSGAIVYLNWDADRTAEAWFSVDGVGGHGGPGGHGLTAADFLL